MSLKAFHLVFIVASVLLAFGFGAWLIDAYVATGSLHSLIFGILSGLAGLALLVYGRYFLKKFKHIGYI